MKRMGKRRKKWLTHSLMSSETSLAFGSHSARTLRYAAISAIIKETLNCHYEAFIQSNAFYMCHYAHNDYIVNKFDERIYVLYAIIIYYGLGIPRQSNIIIIVVKL